MCASTDAFFQFDDFTLLLQFAYRRRKALRPGFGLQKLASKIGFNSAGAISMMLKGQRGVAPGVARRIAKALDLNEKEGRFFVALAERAEFDDEKTQRTLDEIRNMAKEELVNTSQYQFLSQWYCSALYCLVGTEGFEWNPEKLSKRFGGKISPSEIIGAMDTLLRAGLVHRENGRFEQKAIALRTPDETKSLAIRNFHRQVLALAAKAMQLPSGERDISGVTLTLSPSQFDRLKEKIRDFRKQINEEFSSSEKSQEVYQVEIELFPLTFGSQTCTEISL